MNVRTLAHLTLGLGLLGSGALADDRSACLQHDDAACRRIGELRQHGALKADGTVDREKLVSVCGAALAPAQGTLEFGEVVSACGQLFHKDMQRSLRAVAPAPASMREAVLTTAFAEHYCPRLKSATTGCRGRAPERFSGRPDAHTRLALKALTTAALTLELGAETARPLGEKFAAAWDVMLGAAPPEGLTGATIDPAGETGFTGPRSGTARPPASPKQGQ